MPRTSAQLDQRREQKARHRARVRATVSALKIASGCRSCGESHPACLHYHHVDARNKVGRINKMVHASAAAREAEIAKCILLCANCHAKLHSLM